MELSSDSDDCQLYTRAAQNVEKKVRKLQDRPTLDQFEEVIKLPDDEIENIGFVPDDEIGNRPISFVKQSDSDDDIPLSILCERLCRNEKSTGSKSRRKSDERTRQRGRKRRRNISSATRPNGIDLGVIVFDDDSEYPVITSPIDFNSRSKQKDSRVEIINDSIDDSINGILTHTFDEDDCDENDVTISVEWHNGKKLSREEFKLRKYQKFQTVFEQLAKKEGLPFSHILLMHNFNSIRPSDTPSSLNLNFYGALTGSVSKTVINHDKSCLDTSGGVTQDNAKDGIKIKLQLQSQKTLNICVMNNEKLGVLYKKCSEELGLDEGKLKITFDGEMVEASDLVSDLDLEDGDIFHVHIKS